MIQTRFLYLIFLITFHLQAFSQATDLKFEKFTTGNGLSNIGVICIYEDSKGYLWIGTYDGLNRYDGYTFEHFFPDQQDTNSISDFTIRSIYEDHLGYIWIGTDNGLNKYDPEHGHFKHFYNNPSNPNTISKNKIDFIIQDQYTVMWFLASDNKLNKYDRMNNRFKRYALSDLNLGEIYLDYTNENALLLIGTNRGLYVFDPVKEIFYPFIEDQSHILNHVSVSAIQSNDDYLWIGTTEKGVIEWDKKKQSYQFLELNRQNIINNSSGLIFSIKKDDKNNLWIGTKGEGMFQYNLKNRTSKNYYKDITNPNSISDNSVLTILCSDNGLIWAGTYLGGLNKVSLSQGQNKFAHLFYGNIVNSAIELNDGSIICGTRYNGLLIYDRKTEKIKQIKNINNRELFNITLIQPSENKDEIFLNAEDLGIIQYNYKNNTAKEFFTRYRYSPIYLMLQTSEYIIVGGWATGLVFLDKKGAYIKRFEFDPLNNNSLSANHVFSGIRDQKNNLWIGTTNGLNKIEAKENGELVITVFKHKKDSNSLCQNEVFTLCEDNYGNIWAGTQGGGISKYDPVTKKFTSYTTSDGLPSNMIFGILEDKNKNLWISTSKGLCKFNHKIEKFTVYTKKDGIQDEQFFINSYSKGINGNLLFGGINGLNVFNPDSVRKNINRNIPTIVISGYKILKGTKTDSTTKKLIIIPDKIELSYKNNDIQFEFSSLDFTFPEKNEYAYKLEGYDERWVYTDATNRIARYTNIKQGTYTFTVKGSNNDGVWNDKGISVQLVIKPPFWLSYWFLFSIGIILLGVLIYVFRSFIYTIKTQQIQSEETLFNKENQLKTLIDNLPDFIYIKDRQCRFILANHRVTKVMTGSDKNHERLIGKKDHDFYEKELADQFYNDEQYIMQTGEPLIGRIEPGIDEKGKRITVSTTKVPIKNSKGEVIGLVGIGRDITEVKEAEEKIRQQADELLETNTLLEERQEEIMQQKEELEAQRDELETLNATKDKFFSIIGHDLKNPFSAIMSLSDILNKNFENIEESEKIEIISMIKDSAENAFDLLQNLLQWARSQTNRIEYAPENFNIKELVEDNIQLLQVNAEKKEITIFNKIEEDITIHADKNMMDTVIRNIINNAIKFTDLGGQITVATEIKEQNLEITISDTGIGMDNETLDKIFRIEEGHTTYGTSGEKGTGLGLLLCKEFVEKNKGTINVESQVGKGSSFIISLPMDLNYY